MDPAGQVAAAVLGELADDAAGRRATGPQVVARDDGERGRPGGAAPGQRLDQQPGQGPGRGRVGEVVCDLWARGVQGPGRPGRAVPGFGHGDGDDLDGGVGEAPERRLRVAGGDDRLADGADESRPVAAVAALEQRVQMALTGQRAVQVRRAQGDSADAAAQRARGQDVVAVDGLVGTVEYPRPDVDDRGTDAGDVVGRHGRTPRGRGRQPGPRRVVSHPLQVGRHRRVGRHEGPAGSADL